MKVCHVVFSTNRIEFLKKTFEANKKFDFTGLEVHHLFIDDYPTDRNDHLLSEFVKYHGYNEIILHKENLGITKTWQELFDLIKDRDYDYILHHEDDVELMYNLKVMDLVEILQQDNTLSQIQLKRNNWYPHETEEVGPKEDDVIFKDYRYEKATPYFWMLMSLYPAWISKEPILSETGYNPSESVIAKYLKDKYNIGAGLLKTKDGDIMVNHIGNYFHGKRVGKDEPGWDQNGFKYIDPNIKYCSKTGKALTNNMQDCPKTEKTLTNNMQVNLIVVDNFYNDVDSVRELALSQEFSVRGNYPGLRTKSFLTDSAKEVINSIVSHVSGGVTDWLLGENNEEYTGAFQLCTASDRTWIHSDCHNMWAGVCYLTPNAPLSSGTAFYMHKKTGNTKSIEINDFGEDSQDYTKWEIVDKVSNVYNRLILFRGNLFHSSLDYFGNNLQNGRLFQTFFFNTKY